MRNFTRPATALCALLLVAPVFAPPARTAAAASGRAQTLARRDYVADVRRALASRSNAAVEPRREGAYVPSRDPRTPALGARAQRQNREGARRRRPAGRPDRGRHARAAGASNPSAPPPRVRAGTPLSRVLHTSQLSLISTAGTNEQYADQNGDLSADERTTFDADGGSFDIALGRSGSRYEVFSSIDTRGTAATNDDVPTGVLVVGRDSNGDFVRDPGAPATFDLGRDFRLPSAVSVVAGASAAGREFVVVSSSGYFNSDDPDDPDNEPSPGVVLLVRDFATGGFDPARTRELVRVGDDRLFNANALALLPTGDLVVADFQSNELRAVRDTDGDLVPDTLDPEPFYTFPFSSGAEDAPLDIAANSRGVVFTHTAGNDTRLLAVYDTDGDRFGDVDDIVVEGLSIDNNLVLHGLTVGRDGTVYVVEDATGAHDLPADGGNGGAPLVQAFPDPALNGLLRDGSVFASADDAGTQALSGLALGVDTLFGAVGPLTMTNAASLRGDAPSGGLAAIRGAGLTRGLSGATESEAAVRGVRVSIEGNSVPVLSFDDSHINVHVPAAIGTGDGSVVVSLGGTVTAAADARIVGANPGIFTQPQTGAGEAVALLVSGERYTRAPLPAKFGGQPSVVALFGTGWRNSPPLSVTVGGRACVVEYAGASGGFPGLEQLNVRVPDGTPAGPAHVIIRTADGATSRADVFITVQ